MTTLRNLNRAVQSAEFPSHEWAQGVREWIDKATERMEPERYVWENVNEGCVCSRNSATGERRYCDYHKALMQPEPASEPAKVECPNCGKMAGNAEHFHYSPAGYTCQPAQPEPAAPVNAWRTVRQMERMLSGFGSDEPTAPVGEIPEAVRRAIQCLRETNAGTVHSLGVDGKVADALETFWRTHAAQPKVAMTEELERVLSTLHILAGEMGTNVGNGVRADIAAVRAQASQPQRGR